MINDLAFQKDFASLSPAECAQVLSEMSETEYARLRELLLSARELDASARPPEQLRGRLMAHMSQQRVPQKSHWLTGARIPLWQAAAALAFAVAATYWMKKETVREKNVTTLQLRVDTVFQEKIVWRDRVVVKNRIIRENVPIMAPMASVPVSEKALFPVFVPEFQPTGVETHIGTSLGDAPELLELFTQ